ncbi:MAG: hypothetical protein OHK0029_30330 [Armatimonadaceae bacterium]
MSDETTGMTNTAEQDQPTLTGADAPAVEVSASPDSFNGTAVSPNGNTTLSPSDTSSVASDAGTTGSTDSTFSMEDDLEQMPPLDEIEVPGMEPDSDRSGGATVLLTPGQVVEGVVVHIDNEGVLVDVGAKTEGLIRPNELSREPVSEMTDVVKVGDRIDVLVLEPESRDGHPILSKKRADFEKAWDDVQKALEDGSTLMAMVSDRVRGGLVVDLGIRGFVPASHVGNGRLRNLDKFVGQSIPLKVLEVDRHNRKVVLSHRLATEEERERERQETLNALAEGQVRTGTVRRVTDYGAFVDIGGIDGLLHVSEMAWTRVNHPSDVVKVGDQVQVMILKLSLDQGRISLGMRQILPDPWDSVADQYHVGETVEGEVTRIVPFGAFVLLQAGIEGIIPNSELAWRRVAKASDVVESGQTVQVKVIDVRAAERRLTLSLRALQPREEAQPERVAEPGAAPPEEGAGGRRDKRERRRGRDDEAGGGGNFRQFTRTDSGGGFGSSIGDMFPELLSASRGGGGKKGREKERRRRVDEDEDFDETELDTLEEEDVEQEQEEEN